MNELMPYLVLSLLVAPLLAILSVVSGGYKKTAALIATGYNLVVSIFLLVMYTLEGTSGGYLWNLKVPMMQFGEAFSVNFHTGVDGINLPLILLTTLVSFAAVAVSPKSVKRAAEFYVLLLLIIVGALGAFLSLDLFFLYVFHEVALIPSFLLIGVWGSHDRKFAATQLTLYLVVGSLVLLAGLIGFVMALPKPTLDLIEITELMKGESIFPGEQGIIFLLLLIGFGILVSLWPFHTWAPRGYASAPSPVAMLHAGVLKKFGIYGLLRMGVPFLPTGMEEMMPVLLILLLFNILFIGLVTISQKELDMMLGYSSVMHMGYLFLGLASANIIGLTGVVFLMVGHGLSTALLFGLLAEIRKRGATTRMSEMGGLATKAPLLSFCFILGAFASIGLPGLANFPGELMIFFGAWKEFPIVTLLAIWGVVISAVYMLRAVSQVCYGPVAEKFEDAEDFSSWKSAWPFLLLAGALLILGVYPKLLTRITEPSLGVIFGG